MIEHRPIPSVPGYTASSDGRVWRNARPLRCRDNGRGYRQVTVSVANRRLDRYVHRLVCEAFHGPPPPDHDASHLDGCRTNNAPANLQWATRRENMAHQLAHGTRNWRERNGQARLTTAQVESFRLRAASGELIQDIAADAEASRGAVRDAIRGRKWRSVQGAIPPTRRTLTADERAAILAALAAGARKADVARAHSLPWAAVHWVSIGGRPRATKPRLRS